MMTRLHEGKVWRTSLFPDAASTQIVWKLRPANRGLLIFPTREPILIFPILIFPTRAPPCVLKEKHNILYNFEKRAVDISHQGTHLDISHLDISHRGTHLVSWKNVFENYWYFPEIITVYLNRSTLYPHHIFYLEPFAKTIYISQRAPPWTHL